MYSTGLYTIYSKSWYGGHDVVIESNNNNSINVKNINYDYASNLKKTYAKYKGCKPIVFDPKLYLNMIHCEVEKVFIDRSKRTTIVVLKNGYVGYSKCHEDDEYSIIIGYRMAYLKAKQNEINSEMKKLNKVIDDKEYDWAYRIEVNDMGGNV